jgi:hypothetical protein
MTLLNKKFWIGVALFLLAVFISSCGSSQAEMDALNTEVAKNIFASQTAEVPAATDTPEPTEIPPTETIEPTQTIAPTSEPVSGDVLYTTDFSDLESWSVDTMYLDQVGYVVEQQGINLHLVVPGSEDGQWVYPDYLDSLYLRDVRVEVDAELIGGSNYTYIALMCRSTMDGEYIFYVDTGGFAQIGKWWDAYNEYEQLAYRGSTAINIAKAINHIAIECQGNELSLFINDEEVLKVIDEDYVEGTIGLGVETFDYPTADVLFRNLEVLVP